MAKLGEVCLINPKSCTLRDDTEVSFIPMTKVGEHGEFDASEIKNYSEVKKGFTNFQNGDILFAKITPCMENGKGAIAHNMKNGIGFGSTEFHVLRPDTDKITSEWLYYLTTWKAFRKEAERNMTGSAGQKRVPKTFLEKYVVNLPDIDTQKSENKILRKVDDLIFLRKQQLAKLDELVKARFVEMFGDINVNNKKWMTYPLGELCTIVRGGSPRPIERYLGGTIPWIKIGDATTGENIYLNSTKEYIIQEGVKKSRMIKAGSLIFANCGVSLGFARIITFDGCIHDGWLAMEDIDEKLDKIFLLYSLNQMTEYFRKTAPAGTQPNLNTNIMKMHRQIVPPMEMQKAFISFVKCADRQKQIVQQSLEKLELMKKALMQEYFG